MDYEESALSASEIITIFKRSNVKGRSSNFDDIKGGKEKYSHKNRSNNCLRIF